MPAQKLSMSALHRISVEEFKAAEKLPVMVVLDNIRSLNNIGSVFRTADAFRLSGICLCGITATPPHREIHKTALGATESVAWQHFETTAGAISWLHREGYLLIAVEQTRDSIPLNRFFPQPNHKMAFIFGNEVNGVEEEVLALSDGCIEIPQFGTKHSINVSVAVGIVIWDLFTKLPFYQKK